MTNILFALIDGDPDIWAVTDWDRHGLPLGVPLGISTVATRYNLGLLAEGRLIRFFHDMARACDALDRIEAATRRVTYWSGYPSAQDPDRSTDPKVLERLRETGR